MKITSCSSQCSMISERRVDALHIARTFPIACYVKLVRGAAHRSTWIRSVQLKARRASDFRLVVLHWRHDELLGREGAQSLRCVSEIDMRTV